MSAVRGLRALVLLLGGMFVALSASAQTQWSVGYFDPADGISVNTFNGTWGGLSHLIVMSCSVNSSGTASCGLSNPATQWPAIVSAAHANGAKALLGWNDIGGSSNLLAAATNAPSTAISNIMSVVNTYGFDGIALDWEGTLPNGANSTVTTFVHSIRVALGSKSFVATAFPCCAGGVWAGSVNDLDRLMLMTYDMGGGNSNFCWYNSSLFNPVEFPPGPNTNNDGFSTDGSVTYYEAHGWPAAKLNIGIPFYGNQHSSATTARHPCGSAGQVHFNTIYNTYNHLQNLQFDIEAGAAWQSISGGYIDVEDQQTVTNKVNYVKAHGLGGFMEFSLTSDYLSGGSPQHPILGWIQTALGAPFGSPPTISAFSASPTSIFPGSSSTLSWSTTGATSLSINQGVGTVTGTSTSVSPSVTTIYTLTASNSAGSVSRAVTVTVTAPTISSFSASPTIVTSGGLSTLSWSTSGATSCAINQGVGTVTCGASSVGVHPTANTTYTLTATNSVGSTPSTAAVTVTTAPHSACALILQ